MKFYDREAELEVLHSIEIQSRNSATFTVLMGRRRVGKTSLIMRAMQDVESAYLFVSKDSEAFLCSLSLSRNFMRAFSMLCGMSSRFSSSIAPE